jgi:hypothetical protein
MNRFQLCIWGVLGLLGAGEVGAAQPKYGPEGTPHAVPLVEDSGHLRNPARRAPDYWALAGFYVPQFNGAACSLASVTMVLNAARSRLPRHSETRVILQQELLSQIGGEWKRRVAPFLGLSSVRGVTLDLLARFAQEAFRRNGFPNAKAEAVRLDARDAESLARLRRDLEANEASASDFILLNFDQKWLTDDTSVGHIAPVGAYDSARRRVLVMEPDREWYEPYWVSDERLLGAMATIDGETGLSRGYVKIAM